MPREAYQVLRKTKYTPLDIKSFEKELLILIRRSTPEELNRYREVNEGLNYKLKSLSNQVSTYEELVTGLKSKRYTQTKINRLLINILLGIEKEDHTIDEVGYLRILGFDETGRNMAHLMKKNATLPVITNINKVEPSLKKNPLLQLDIRASDIYAAGQNNPKHRTGGRDHTQKIIIL
jgi:predicted nucleotidyltransferase